MSTGKGKGRASDQGNSEETQLVPDKTSESLSMISRIAASASGLSKGAFSAPTSKEISDTTNSALSNSGKGPSSSARGGGNSSWEESSKQAQTQPQTSGNATGNFRLGHSELHVNESEQEFSNFLDGIDSFTPSEQPTSSEKIERGVNDAFEYAWARSQVASAAHIPAPAPVALSSVEEQESRDGEAVLAILSDPNSFDEQFEEPQDDTVTNQNWGLSEKQIVELRAMTKDLFSPFEPHGAVPLDHPLNLRPSFGADAMGQVNGYGVHDPNIESTEEWREQWEGVLTRYADEVWGDLLPLVKEARKEVEELLDAPPAVEQTKALRRLGAILGHLPPR
ncbi:hypothetical protein HYFRA_00007484 [Hymenoscyphus fraxineus]|uniref:Uncharacterized protein n=1 Tax=Hymenoscyphus fraxineus TaxID=746836 RepID=A0A9N9KRW7_9HELO|nr:hypothetical protein HYFRA_00007484 [Hymenoscyphus fraxineus]